MVRDGHWSLAEMVIGGSLAPHKSLLIHTPLWIVRVGKKLSVKADLAIYSYVYGVSG